MTEGSVIILVASLLLLFQFIDSFTIFKSLLEAGFSKTDSMMLKGVYDRGQPLIQLGMVVGNSFSMASLPLLRKKVIKKRLDRLEKKLSFYSKDNNYFIRRSYNSFSRSYALDECHFI